MRAWRNSTEIPHLPPSKQKKRTTGPKPKVKIEDGKSSGKDGAPESLIGKSRR